MYTFNGAILMTWWVQAILSDLLLSTNSLSRCLSSTNLLQVVLLLLLLLLLLMTYQALWYSVRSPSYCILLARLLKCYTWRKFVAIDVLLLYRWLIIIQLLVMLLTAEAVRHGTGVARGLIFAHMMAAFLLWTTLVTLWLLHVFF